jgi:uncharacterized protein YecT (DUF1311 family)
VRTTLAIAALVLATLAARADDPPDPKGAGTVQMCLKSQKPSTRAYETCIDVAYHRCIGPEENAKSSAEQVGCLRREKPVWDQLLNDAFRKLRDGLDDDQRVKLRDMQRSWVDMRDKTCAFYYDYFQGSMANPMIANCDNRETARRAIFLMGFAEDMAGWVKDKSR